VTCLCLTKDRREWLPKALQCFQKQTYPHLELLILSDGRDVRDLVPDAPRIRLIQTSKSFNSIGEKRNYACEHARGDVICHWDDDDWSEPERVAIQVEMLLAQQKSVVGFHTMRFTNGSSWWEYRGSSTYALGTSLCYLRSWWRDHPFEPKQVGEDSSFVRNAGAAKELFSVDARSLMYATIHDGNTSPRMVSGNSWARVEGFLA
jgi:glycosyltransferase involved in cell wall biosynthesis